MRFSELSVRRLPDPEPLPAETPIDASIDTPIDTPIDAPTESPVDAPTESPADAQVDTPADAPIESPADAPPTVAEQFTAQIVVLQHPSAITAGYTPVFHCHTAQIACTFLELKKKLDPRTGQTKEENPTFLKAGDAAIVEILPSRPLVIENIKEIPQLGRFAIRDMGSTIAAGMCIGIKPKQIIR